MLQHVECPHCHAPNLSTEVVCFACGSSLRALPKHLRSAPAPVPWLLWVGLLVGLVLVGFIGWCAAAWLAGYRLRAAVPKWYFPAAGAVLLVAAQGAFAEARRIDRRWWQLKRAPHLPMAQVHTGDSVWVRGKLQCESALIAPYTAQECAYYRYLLRERQEDRAGWHTTEKDSNCVDFTVAEGEKSLYVPSGGVLFDAQLYTEAFLSDTVQVRVWALAVGLPVSVCGQVAGETDQPRMDALGPDLPVVATWREPSDYVALTARRAKLAQGAGWALTAIGALTLIAGVAPVY
jgi:hypothetical protein